MAFLTGGILDFLSQIREKTEGGGTFSRTTDSLEAISDAVAAATLSAAEKSRVNMGWRQQVAFQETFAGLLPNDSRIAANNSITAEQLAQQSCRYPGAPAWTYRGDGTFTVSQGGGSAICFTLAPGATNNKGIATLAYVPIRSLYPSIDISSTSLVVEFDLIIDGSNNDGDDIRFFAGIVGTTLDGDWSTVDWGNKSDTVNRFGFVTDNAANKYLTALSAYGGSISTITAFDASNFNGFCRLKIVWNLVTPSISFYYNGVLAGTITTNTPGYSSFGMYPAVLSYNVSAQPTTFLFGFRMYYE